MSPPGKHLIYFIELRMKNQSYIKSQTLILAYPVLEKQSVLLENHHNEGACKIVDYPIALKLLDFLILTKIMTNL